MKGIQKYRNIYVIIGIIFAIIVTQSSLDNQTQRWVLLTYVVLGIIATEYIGRIRLKKKTTEQRETNGIQKYWNIYVIIAIIFSLIIALLNLSDRTQVTVILAYIVLGFLSIEFIVRKILKKKANEK